MLSKKVQHPCILHRGERRQRIRRFERILTLAAQRLIITIFRRPVLVIGFRNARCNLCAGGTSSVGTALKGSCASEWSKRRLLRSTSS